MNKVEFIEKLQSVLPQTTWPIVPNQVIPLDDNLWIKILEVAQRDGDPIKTAKVVGLMNHKNMNGEVHVALLDKAEYVDADLARAVALIQEADKLSPLFSSKA